MADKQPIARPASATRPRPASASRPRPVSATGARTSIVADSSVKTSIIADAGGLSNEVTRMSNALRAKEREMEEAAKELAAVKSGLNIKDRALQQQLSAAEGLKNRALQAEGQLAVINKDHVALKTEKKKLESTLADQARQLDKLLQQVATLQSKVPDVAGQVASLQSENRSAKAECVQAQEKTRALDNVMRNKDRELARLQKRVAEVDALEMHNKELENVMLKLRADLEEGNAANKALTQLNRARELEVAKLVSDLEASRDSLSASQAALSTCQGCLKTSEQRVSELEQELALLRDDLARTSAVAARVAASEVKGGSKSEGTVSVVQHVEEVKHLAGEIARLRERIALQERDLAVAHEIKEKFKAQAQSASPAPRRATTASLVTPPGSAARGAKQRLLMTGEATQQQQQQPDKSHLDQGAPEEVEEEVAALAAPAAAAGDVSLGAVDQEEGAAAAAEDGMRSLTLAEQGGESASVPAV